MMLDQQTFITVVGAAPLVSLDILMVRGGCEVLLGLRNNRPAQGFWFLPGGRILKNETINQAFLRIAKKELGLEVLDKNSQLNVTFYGNYEHFYDDCFAGDVGVSTHYVVLAHKVDVPENTPLPTSDEQHIAFKWWSIQEALQSKEVHQYTKNYFIQG
jgi:colanic acid biosynthesis protein WcaH